MAKGFCFICANPITSGTDSKEHLFQNAIGGRRKVGGFLHDACNHASGGTWDQALADQMNPLCLLLGIVRERGASPSMQVTTTAGERFALGAAGGLEVADTFCEVVDGPEGKQIRLKARDRAQAREMLEKIQREEVPNLEIKKILRAFPITTSYPEGAIPLSFQFGGRAAGPAMVKTAAAFAHSVGVDTRMCDLAADYVRDPSISPPFGYYGAIDLVRNRQPGLPMHAVAVTGDSQTGMLVGYVEYFGAVRILVGLSETYTGSAIHSAYGEDPLTGATVSVDIEPMRFSRDELKAVYDCERTPFEAMKANFAPVLDAMIKRQFEREKNRVIKDAVDYAFRNCGAKLGEILTEEQLRKMSALVSERMMPFIARHIVREPAPFSPQSPAGVAQKMPDEK